MYVDRYGLPVQRDGDNKDQLHRVGMLVSADVINGTMVQPVHELALKQSLQPAPGIFSRSVGSDVLNCSADQIISALCALLLLEKGSSRSVRNAFLRMITRLGFAQNIKDGLNDSTHKKIPDFMALRALPIFLRNSWITWPLALIFDLYVPVLVLGDWWYKRTDKDPADCNNTVLTLVTCVIVKPTPISLFSVWLAKKLKLDFAARLERYHRAESGGNPEVAFDWQPICERYFV